MIIGVDAHFLGNKQSGNETYIRRLVESMADQYRNDTFRLYLTNDKALDDPLFCSSNVEACLIKPANPAYRVSIGLPAELYKRPVDVLHVQYNAPLFSPTKLVVTMHDISWAKYPEWFTYLKGRQITLRARFAVADAAAIICGTNFTKREISDWYGLSPKAISVTPYGIDRPAERSAAQINEVLHRHKINRPYILHVGDLQPRKNIAQLVRAFKETLKSGLSDMHLVLAGKPAGSYRDILNTVKELDLTHKVNFAGYVDDDDLPALYQGAEAFVYPTLYEGFGFPPLEAMAQGVPVVASNTGAVAEVAGDAARLFDPTNVHDMANSISAVVKNDRLKRSLIESGFERVSCFNWETTARMTMDIFRNVHRGSIEGERQ